MPSSVLTYLISLGNQADKRHSQGWLIRGNTAQEKGGKDLQLEEIKAGVNKGWRN